MTVNEGADDISISPIEKEADFLGCLAKCQEEIVDEESNRKVAQQPTAQQLTLPAESTVRYFANNNTKICQIVGIDEETEDKQPTSKIRVLNSDKEFIVPNASIESITSPEPSDILQHPMKTNVDHIAEVMHRDKILEIWKTPDSDFTEDEKLFYYWHKRLRCLPKKYIRRLSEMKCLPYRLKFVK